MNERLKKNFSLFSKLAVPAFLAVAVFLTANLAQNNQDPRKQAAASCPATSFISLTNSDGQVVTSAKSGDKIKARVFVTGKLDAADIFIGYNTQKLETSKENVTLNNVNNFIHRKKSGEVYLNVKENLNQVALLVKRVPQSPLNINGEIAAINFTVVSQKDLAPASIIYMDKTIFSKKNSYGGLECGTKTTISVSNIASPTSSPLSSATPTATQPPSPTPTFTAQPSPSTSASL